MSNRSISKHNPLLLTLISALLLALLALPGQSKAKSDASTINVIKLTQVHFFFGATETYITPVSVRVDNLGPMHFSLVACAPDWTVTVYRNDDRSYFVESIERLEVNGLINDYFMHRQDHILGANLIPREQVVDNFKIKEVCTHTSYVAYLPVAKNASVPVERVLYAAYKIPTNGGIPLKFIRTRYQIDWFTRIPKNQNSNIYLTTKAIEWVKVPREFFAAPRGYTLKKTVQEVLVSDANRTASGDMTELFDISKAKKTGP